MANIAGRIGMKVTDGRGRHPASASLAQEGRRTCLAGPRRPENPPTQTERAAGCGGRTRSTWAALSAAGVVAADLVTRARRGVGLARRPRHRTAAAEDHPRREEPRAGHRGRRPGRPRQLAANRQRPSAEQAQRDAVEDVVLAGDHLGRRRSRCHDACAGPARPPPMTSTRPGMHHRQRRPLAPGSCASSRAVTSCDLLGSRRAAPWIASAS